MSNLRKGTYGSYYGSYFNESALLTTAQMQENAEYIYAYLTDQGWSIEAICGLLGNMQWESGINPGRWQSDNVGATSSGYGLVQWTPASDYIAWCGDRDPSDMDVSLSRIIYELEHGVQYYGTNDYPLSFRSFSKSTETPYYLACAFAWNYERSWTVLYGSEAEKEALRQKRGSAAESWYNYLSGIEPGEPDDPYNPTPRPPNKRKEMSLLLMYLATRR